MRFWVRALIWKVKRLNLQENVKDLLNSLLQAIECEREEERERHISEIKSLSPLMREKKGRALINLKKRKPEITLTGDYIYSFYKKDKSDLPDTEIAVGDQVVISQYDPLDSTNPSAIVYEVGKNYIKLQTPVLIKGVSRPYRLDLFVNDLTYMRMEKALSQAKSPANNFIQEILAGNYFANTKPYENGGLPKDLNQKQQEALEYSLSCNGFYSVQGPPGTGKTYLAARIVKVLVEAGKKVLISADSNAAVDNFLQKCIDVGLDPVRVGHPIRVNQNLKPYSLDYRVVRHALFENIALFEKEIEKKKERLRELDKPSQSLLRGLSYQEVMNLIEKNQSARGLSKRTLRGMKPYVKTALKIEKLYEKIKEVKQDISFELMQNASVIATTNSTAASEIMESMHFDFAIVDEASQASIPSTLIPILKADRFILVGDHFQLPPVVISREAVEKGLDNSLMNYLAEKYPYQICMLEKQYRMNSAICNLVSKLFYNSNLIADDSVRNRQLKVVRSLHSVRKAHYSRDDKIEKNTLLSSLGKQSIPLSSRAERSAVERSHQSIPLRYAPNPAPLEFINIDGKELIKSDSKSYFNLTEADFCLELSLAYIKKGIQPSEIAIITPYRAQVETIRKLIKKSENNAIYEGIEIDTVDAFQGREKDLVIISSVRANQENKLGFLSDKRRLNVSISRAKKKLILLGSEKLLSSNQLYKAVILSSRA